jgi:8-oxo-dGTP pyrophosphatase MutT (NUDIX family)
MFGLGTKALMSPVAFGVNAIVDDEEGRIILVRQTYMQGLHLPGGGVSSGEPPAQAILRELREEIGLTSSAPPEFMGLYTRQFGFITNVVALYRVRDAKFDSIPKRRPKMCGPARAAGSLSSWATCPSVPIGNLGLLLHASTAQWRKSP